MEVPSTWPENCPPDESVDAAGTAFRVVQNDPPNESDFKNYVEMGKLPKAPQCLRLALSVFQTVEQAYHLSRMKSAELGKYVAEGTLAVGKMRVTPKSGHINWWTPEGYDRKSTFTKVLPTPGIVP
jgi:hypothetical protein